MNWRIRMKKRHALFVLVATCSAISYLFGFIAHAETVRGEEGRFETGDTPVSYTHLDVYKRQGYFMLKMI